jgi:hydrogenase expression/formation protein HypC
VCLGIPGQIVEIVETENQLAKVEVSGVRRNVNIALLADEPEGIGVGDWVLIHVGFAMSKIDEEEARLALASLQMLGEVYTDEVEALLRAPSGEEPARGAPRA